MKKFLSISLIYITLTGLAFSEPLKQFQTFSWKKVSKAKKYEITIEKESGENSGSYVPELSEQLTDNRVEFLLYPGNYRVAISVFNVLGKKTSTTDWTNFIILDETEPYLYPNSFKNSKRWNSPVLNLKQDGIQMVEEEDDEGAITAREGDPTNSFFLRGKNIFFEETSFSMLPKETSIIGNPFEAYVDMRKEIPLNIVRRDTENGGVVVEYSPDALFSGYYDIVAKNPGGEQTSLELLVLSYQAPVIDNSIYLYDENYKVNIITVTKGLQYDFKIRGKGFDSNTLYSFTPDSSLPPYPFASSFDLENPSFFLKSHNCIDETGTIEITFNLTTSNLHTGYYCFDANNGVNGSDSTIFLIKVNPTPAYSPDIQKVKTKNGGDADTIMFNVTGQNIDENSKITLISPYSESADANTRIPLTYLATKKKGNLHIMQSDKTAIEAGQYALLVENTASSAVFYFDVDEKLNFELYDISEAEKESLFLRPKSKKQSTKEIKRAIESEFTLNQTGLKYYSTLRTILPAAHFNLTYVNIPGMQTEANNFETQFKLDLLYFKWVRLDIGGSYYSWKSYDFNQISYGADLFFEIPKDNIQPYLGVGFYNSFNNKDYYTIPITAGIRFFKIFEISYQLSLENALSENRFATDKITFGLQIPIRSLVYDYISTETIGTIAENNLIDGTNYELRKDTTYLNLDSQRITGFSGNKSVRSILLSKNVESIEARAFADMPSLSDVTLQIPLQYIGEQAFANDTNIEKLIIPATVTTIETNAFEGWKGNQRIILNWTSDDETPRNLSGLDTTKAFISYIDSVPYNYGNNIYIPNNWEITKTNATAYIKFLNLEDDKGFYYNGINLYGALFPAYDSENNGITSYVIYKDAITSSLSATNLKDIKGIKFHAQNNSKSVESQITIFYKIENDTNLHMQSYWLGAGESNSIELNFDGTLLEISHLQFVQQYGTSGYDIILSNFEPIK